MEIDTGDTSIRWGMVVISVSPKLIVNFSSVDNIKWGLVIAVISLGPNPRKTPKLPNNQHN